MPANWEPIAPWHIPAIQHAGGGWTKDLLIINQDEMVTVDYLSHIHPNNIKHKEVFVKKVAGKFRFPLAEHDLRQPSGPHYYERVARPTVEDPQEANPDVLVDEESRSKSLSIAGSEPTQRRDPGVQSSQEGNWTVTSDLLVRHHRFSRAELYVPFSADCPIPLKSLGVMRSIYTSVGPGRSNSRRPEDKTHRPRVNGVLDWSCSFAVF